MRIDDPGFVAREYATMDRFARRRLDVTGWIREIAEPIDTMLIALREARPRRVLDAGCGTGELGALLVGCDVVGVDVSPAAVEEARRRGIDARIGDVQALEFADGEFDAVLCNWMLYHVRDRGKAIAELARVLRPGGRFVGCYNHRGHLAELWDRYETEDEFDCEDAVPELRAAFVHVEARTTGGEVLWESRGALQAYLDAYVEFMGPLEAPPEPYPFRATRRNCVLVADRAG